MNNNRINVYFLILALFWGFESCSKEILSHDPLVEDPPILQEEVFADYELLPEFPGGSPAMNKFRDDNLIYPKAAFENNIEGLVMICFRVNKSGDIDSIRVVRSVHPCLDTEALRIVSSFPKFSSGPFAGEPVDYWFTYPFRFKISEYLKRKNIKFPAFQIDNGDDYVSEGFYRIVDENGRIGYADEDGNTVIYPRFAFGFPFENGKAKVTDIGYEKDVPDSNGEYHYWESDKWYYIDKSGKKIE